MSRQRNLINNDNQLQFEKWQEQKLYNRPEHTTQEQYQKSINQYKSGILALDDCLCGESFNTLTIDILEQAYEASPKKKNHINSFIKDIYILGLDISQEVMLSLFHGTDNKVINKLLSTSK